MLRHLFLLSIVTIGFSANADLLLPTFGQTWGMDFLNALNKTYRIGDEWGKKEVTDAMLEKESVGFSRMARATGRFGGGTAFYLGRFNGEHVVATNHHVAQTEAGCLGKNLSLPWLAVAAPCTKFLGTWSDIDLTLFVITPKKAEDEKALLDVKGNFAFKADVYPGQALITIGFGVADNPFRKQVANQDSDCMVLSAKNDFHFMADPDELNPGPYKAWSFANGCDVSHGDSGSAMVDRSSGQIVGIIWTGRIPKNPKVQMSSVIQDQLKNPSDDIIWKEVSYSVPASKMSEHLNKVILDEAFDADKRQTIEAVLKD